MNTISLYRIKRTRGSAFQAAEAYKIHTNEDLILPETLKLEGVTLSTPYLSWFESMVFPIMEQHMGDLMVERWAVSTAEDPDHITIAVVVNNHLVYPDLLSNTTSFQDSPLKHKQIVYKIVEAVKARENQPLKPLVFCPQWELTAYINYFKHHYPDSTTDIEKTFKHLSA